MTWLKLCVTGNFGIDKLSGLCYQFVVHAKMGDFGENWGYKTCRRGEGAGKLVKSPNVICLNTHKNILFSLTSV